MAQCRSGTLGYNHAVCGGCGNREWYASSCGDRHCPACLGPRQARWSSEVCGRLPDCAHFHVVFTVPEELHGFFAAGYRAAASLLFAAVAETLTKFQKNNWGARGGFLCVLHTWGSALNWHPHIHALVTSGGTSLRDGRWSQARRNYLFPVRAMSKVFRAAALRRIQELDTGGQARWPPALATPDRRRAWRLRLATKNWNIFSRPTLGNTRAAVRYLARYTSRIAIANRRLTAVDPGARTVSFRWKDHRSGGGAKEMTLPGREFLRRFARHLVPKGFRRVRYYGFLAGPKNRFQEAPGAPGRNIGERAADGPRPRCTRCNLSAWVYLTFFQQRPGPTTDIDPSAPGGGRFSLSPSRSSPDSAPERPEPYAKPQGPAASNKWMESTSGPRVS